MTFLNNDSVFVCGTEIQYDMYRVKNPSGKHISHGGEYVIEDTWKKAVLEIYGKFRLGQDFDVIPGRLHGLEEASTTY